VGGFLGIRIEKQNGNAFLLTQTGLIEKVIKAGGIEDFKRIAISVPLHQKQHQWELTLIEKHSMRHGNMPQLLEC
jgi:hypothetical protein